MRKSARICEESECQENEKIHCEGMYLTHYSHERM